jgi:hypothetical protein
MGNPTLTKLWMATILVVFTIATLFGLYSQFVVDNHSNIDAKYYNAFVNITGQYDNLTSIGSATQNEGIVKKVLDFGQNLVTGTVNIFVVGLDAMGEFFKMIPIIGNVLSALDIIPGFSGLISLLIILVGVYIAMRYIQSTSNKFDLP